MALPDLLDLLGLRAHHEPKRARPEGAHPHIMRFPAPTAGWRRRRCAGAVVNPTKRDVGTWLTWFLAMGYLKVRGEHCCTSDGAPGGGAVLRRWVHTPAPAQQQWRRRQSARSPALPPPFPLPLPCTHTSPAPPPRRCLWAWRATAARRCSPRPPPPRCSTCAAWRCCWAFWSTWSAGWRTMWRCWVMTEQS